MNVGWYWGQNSDSSEPSLRLDATHLNGSGRYLASLTHYQFLFARPAKANAYRPEELPPHRAESLRTAAQAALDSYRGFNANAVSRPVQGR